MASDVLRLRDRSILDLLKSSGYLESHEAITEQHLLAYLQANRDLIRSWIIYSENRRTSCGYYFLGPDNTPDQGGHWVIGYYPGRKEEHFSDGPTACARFVKLEAENLRYFIEGGPPIKARQ